MSGDREVSSLSSGSTSAAMSPAMAPSMDGGLGIEAAPRPLLLDGGLATALEDEGFVLDDPLWSAALVSTQPEAIRRVHARYLAAGADVITTATYQATFEGLSRPWGSRTPRTHAEAARVFLDAITLADEARREHAEQTGRGSYVAASVGSYGAFLADGSEYRGRYGVARDTLLDLHAPRLDLLGGDPRVDVLACETVPSGEEAVLLAELLVARGQRGWVSVVVEDHGQHHEGDGPVDVVLRLADGTPLREVVEAIVALGACGPVGDPAGGPVDADATRSASTGRGSVPVATRRCAPLLGVGLNCVRPARVTAALPVLREAGVLEIAAYANAGEGFGPTGWCGVRASPEAFAEHARAWVAAGATFVGGCCRTTPAHIEALRRTLRSAS